MKQIGDRSCANPDCCVFESCLDDQGRTQFRDLLFRRGTAPFYAFDLLWLNGEDLRLMPLIERKRRLRTLVPQPDPYLLYCQGEGTPRYKQKATIAPMLHR